MSTQGAAAAPIDIHAHFIPDIYRRVLAEEGIDSVDGYPLPSWDRGGAVALMERRGLRAQIVSVSAPGVDVIPAGKRADVVRAVNDAAAELVAWRPDRFGAFAMLPLPDVDATLAEIARIYDDLKLDGVGLYTNVQGAYLGDERFRPVFEELDRRKAVIFLHPVAPAGFEKLNTGMPAPTLEYPFDTTRTIVTLIGSGRFAACPDLEIILPHGGGTLPFLASRTALHVSRFSPNLQDRNADDVIALYRRFYYDFTAVAHPYAIDSLLTLAPPDRLLYGSDHPFMPEAVADAGFAFLQERTTPDGQALSGQTLSALVADNGKRLFPRF